MARMHSRAKGKSGSTRPVKHIPSWAPYKGKEVEKLVVKYAKTGKSASEVGMILRDKYGINSVKALTEKSVSSIMAENNVSKKLPDDVLALIQKMIAVKQHFEKNKQDMTAKRGVQLTESKIRRLTKYYKRAGLLPADWALDTTRLKMYLE